MNQTTASANGIYVYSTSGGTATRSTDMDEASDFPAAAFFVIKGSNGDKAFVCTNDSVNLGADAITFTQFAGSGSSPLSFSGGLTKTGDSVTIQDNGVTTAKVNDDAITQSKIAAGAIGTTELAGTSVTQAKLSADSVGASQVINGAIGSDELASKAVTSAKIDD